MERIIDGCLYTRNPKPYAHDIKVHDLGRGQLECLLLPRFGWSEVDALSDIAVAAYREACDTPPTPTVRDLLEKAEENRERATRRARTKVRRLAKFKGLTTLLTLTYRENMTDRARCMHDLDKFIKRVRRVCAGFEYIAVLETQKRGAWHVHLAVQKVQSHYLNKGVLVRSYDLLRSMWRGVVGADNGNVDVSRNKKISRSAARLASYLSKYIGKQFHESIKHQNAYSASGRDLPDALVIRAESAGDLGKAMLDLVDLLQHECGSSKWSSCFIEGGGWYLELTPDPTRSLVT